MSWSDALSWADLAAALVAFWIGEWSGGRNRACNHRWHQTIRPGLGRGYYIACDRCREIRKVTD